MPTPYDALSDANKTALKDEGFPLDMINAFLNTANTTNSVVMSRTPGDAALRLIERRFDLKGFYNKTKSCNWGPMAGFVCLLPWFNKKGADPKAVKSNVGYMCNFLKDMVRLKIKQPSPFIPLRIPQPRLLELAALLQGTLFADLSAPDNKADIIGFAINDAAAPSIIMEFHLAKDAAPPAGEDQLWKVLCGTFWTLDAGNWQARNPALNWGLNPAAAWEMPVLSDAATALLATGFRAPLVVDPPNGYDEARATALNLVPAGALRNAAAAPSTKFSPVMGCMNPYPPYSAATTAARPAAPVAPVAPPNPAPVAPADPAAVAAAEAANVLTFESFHRNAVSGDFDLFAVWPRYSNLLASKSSPISALVRLGEMLPNTPTSWDPPVVKPVAPDLTLKPNITIFTKVVEKSFTRCLTASPTVLIEFVPQDPPESQDFGNIDQAVFSVATDLNAQAYFYYNKPYESHQYQSNFVLAAANVAFHSDEGGRPFTKDIDLPFALFVPEGLDLPDGRVQDVTQYTRAKLIGTPRDFLSLIMTLKGSCYVPIQAAWFAILVAEAQQDATMAAWMKELVLGKLPNVPNAAYTKKQLAAYQALVAALALTFGTYENDSLKNNLPDVQTLTGQYGALVAMDALRVAP